jgi:hypothetical protein
MWMWRRCAALLALICGCILLAPTQAQPSDLCHRTSSVSARCYAFPLFANWNNRLAQLVFTLDDVSISEDYRRTARIVEDSYLSNQAAAAEQADPTAALAEYQAQGRRDSYRRTFYGFATVFTEIANELEVTHRVIEYASSEGARRGRDAEIEAQIVRWRREGTYFQELQTTFANGRARHVEARRFSRFDSTVINLIVVQHCSFVTIIFSEYVEVSSTIDPTVQSIQLAQLADLKLGQRCSTP